MTSSERPSPEPFLKKSGVPSRTEGERILEMNALDASNASNYRAWGDPSRTLEENSKSLRAFPGSFRNFSGMSSGKSQPVLGVWPKESVSD